MKSKSLIAATMTILFSSTAAAVPINNNATLAETESSKIAVLEQVIFDKVEKDGIEQFFMIFRAALADSDAEQAKRADGLCGQLIEVEKVRDEPLGSRFTRRWYVATHNSCILHWRIAYKRVGAEWSTETIFFNTDYNLLSD